MNLPQKFVPVLSKMEREDSVYKAKLAEQAERYEGMYSAENCFEHATCAPLMYLYSMLLFAIDMSS